VLTCSRGGGEGELALCSGGVTSSGVSPGGHQQDGAFIQVAAPGVLLAIRVPLLAAVNDAGLAQGGEGGRVAAGLGKEMAPVAEHVSPPVEPQRSSGRMLA